MCRTPFRKHPRWLAGELLPLVLVLLLSPFSSPLPGLFLAEALVPFGGTFSSTQRRVLLP